MVQGEEMNRIRCLYYAIPRIFKLPLPILVSNLQYHEPGSPYYPSMTASDCTHHGEPLIIKRTLRHKLTYVVLVDTALSFVDDCAKETVVR